MSEAENTKKPKLTGNFNLAADGTPDNTVPYKDWNIINMQFESHAFSKDIPTHAGTRAINFQYILKNGDVPIFYSDTNKKTERNDMQNQWIDLDAKDSLTQSLDIVQAKAEKKIHSDPTLSSLLDKKSWSRDDRAAWEGQVSKIVSEEVDKIPGLDSYRHQSKYDDLPDIPDTTVKRTTHLNDLSKDITNNTKLVEYDCESMSVIEGVVLQRLDNKMLPSDAPKDDYKKTGNYFYVGGLIADKKGFGGHAFIVSSATGNVIEATAEDGNSPYKKSLDPNYSFDSFVDGKLTPYGQKHQYYGSYYDTQNGITPNRMRQAEHILNRAALADAKDKTELVLEKAQALNGITGMDQLKEAVKAMHGQKINDPHLQEMVADMMTQPDKAKALQDLDASVHDMYKSWNIAIETSGESKRYLSSVKRTFNQYADQIESALQGIPTRPDANALTHRDHFEMFAMQKINTIPDPKPSMTAPVSASASAPATQP